MVLFKFDEFRESLSLSCGSGPHFEKVQFTFHFLFGMTLFHQSLKNSIRSVLVKLDADSRPQIVWQII